MVELFPYDFMTENLYVVPTHHTKNGRTCPGSVPIGPVGPVKLEGENNMQAVMEKVQIKMF